MAGTATLSLAILRSYWELMKFMLMQLSALTWKWTTKRRRRTSSPKSVPLAAAQTASTRGWRWLWTTMKQRLEQINCMPRSHSSNLLEEDFVCHEHDLFWHCQDVEPVPHEEAGLLGLFVKADIWIAERRRGGGVISPHCESLIYV